VYSPAAAKIPRLVQIIQDRIPSLRDAPAEELEIDIDSLDPTTLRELERYVQSVVKKVCTGWIVWQSQEEAG
jgi:hypothetical protein